VLTLLALVTLAVKVGLERPTRVQMDNAAAEKQL
jgi:hypothetical protein